jgi:hypothetical protein
MCAHCTATQQERNLRVRGLEIRDGLSRLEHQLTYGLQVLESLQIELAVFAENCRAAPIDADHPANRRNSRTDAELAPLPRGASPQRSTGVGSA